MYPAEDPKYKPFVSRSASAPTVSAGQESLLVEYVTIGDQINTDPYKLIGWTSGPTYAYGAGEKWLFYDGTGTVDADSDNAIKGGWVALDLTYYYYDTSSKGYKGSGKLSEKPADCNAVFNTPPLAPDGKLADTGTYDIRWKDGSWDVAEKPKWDENTALFCNVYISDNQLKLTGVNTTKMPAKKSLFLVEIPAISASSLQSNRDFKTQDTNDVIGHLEQVYTFSGYDTILSSGLQESSYIGYIDDKNKISLFNTSIDRAESTPSQGQGTATNVTVPVPSTAGEFGGANYTFTANHNYTVGLYGTWGDTTYQGSMTICLPSTDSTFNIFLFSSSGSMTGTTVKIQLASTQLKVSGITGSGALGKTLTATIIDYQG